MGSRGRRGDWWKGLRGAVGLALAYALVFQLVFAGAVAERMAVGGMAGTEAALCLPGKDGPASGGTEQDRLSHLSRCVVCAFAALTPPLPEQAAPVAAPASHHTRPPELALAQAAPLGTTRHDPRTSQGPPASA
ncbi:hypothetical protein [Xanthobacter tagetidis]|uniref:hypothetical protein n=1 Tax=Xanthobacter tagetidis TaxID=60216 RepID=UPI0011C38EB8|nr:hypothetical protein [Xanthobacter tagetidis]MBB6306094.1 hypothetical protein [Xanthobacter tagetidis]